MAGLLAGSRPLRQLTGLACLSKQHIHLAGKECNAELAAELADTTLVRASAGAGRQTQHCEVSGASAFCCPVSKRPKNGEVSSQQPAFCRLPKHRAVKVMLWCAAMLPSTWGMIGQQS